jgi:replicative DNA helicase
MMIYRTGKVSLDADVQDFILQNERKYNFGTTNEERIYESIRAIISAKQKTDAQERADAYKDALTMARTSTYAKLASLLENEHSQEYIQLLYETSTHYLASTCMSNKWLVDSLQGVHGGVS